MGKVSDGLAQRRAQTRTIVGELAYKRLQLTRQIEDIDKSLWKLEGAIEANQFTERDVATETATEAAKKAQEEISQKEEAKQNGS